MASPPFLFPRRLREIIPAGTRNDSPNTHPYGANLYRASTLGGTIMLLNRLASRRIALWISWFLAWAVLILLWLLPQSAGWTRALIVLSMAALYSTSLLLALRHTV